MTEANLKRLIYDTLEKVKLMELIKKKGTASREKGGFIGRSQRIFRTIKMIM